MKKTLWSGFVRKLLTGVATSRARRRPKFAAPRCEEFEPRLVPAVPTVVSIDRVGAAVSNANSIDFAVTFSEPVTGVDAADFQVAKTGTLTNNTPTITGGGATYTVTVAGIAGNGSLGLNL